MTVAATPDQAGEPAADPHSREQATQPEPGWVVRVGGIVLAAWVAAGTAVLSAFLTPLRIGTVLVPLSWVVVVAGCVAAMGIVTLATGRRMALVVPALAWFLVLMPLTVRRAEGDVVVPGTWVGYGLLFIGVATFAVALFRAMVPRQARGTMRPGQ